MSPLLMMTEKLQVSDLVPLIRFNLPVVRQEDTLDVLLNTAASQPNQEAVYVLDTEDRLVGQVPVSHILAYQYPLDALAASGDYFPLTEVPHDGSATVKMLMMDSTVQLGENDSLGQAIRLLLAQRITEIPIVTEQGRLLGILPGRRLLELAQLSSQSSHLFQVLAQCPERNS